MKFNSSLLKTYENIQKNTDLQKGYQEFLRLFRFIKNQLENDLSSFSFSGNIVENGMDYSYFQFSDSLLKSKGLKIVVAFVHKRFTFEVWLSGYNRKYQIKFYEILKTKKLDFELNHQPSKIDYIMKSDINQSIDLSNGQAVVDAIKDAIDYMLEYVIENL